MRSLVWPIWLAVAFSVHGENGSSALRAIFGPPTKKIEAPPREIFTVRPGVEMTVTYAIADSSVCKLEIPSGVASKQQIGQILEQAVPVSTRGKKWNEVNEFTGNSGFRSTYYERLIVIETVFTPEAINRNPGASVIFKTKPCVWKPGDSFDKWQPGDPFDKPPRPESQPKR